MNLANGVVTLKFNIKTTSKGNKIFGEHDPVKKSLSPCRSDYHDNTLSDHTYTLCLDRLTAGMTICPICGVWVSEIRLGQHIEKQHTHKYTIRIFQCEQCGKLCQCQRNLDIHISKYHNEWTSSSLCEKVKKNCTVMKKMDSGETRTRMLYSCQSKGKGKSSRRKCEKCGLLLSTKEKLEWHLRRVHTKTSTFCPICKFYFPVGHLKKEHPEILDGTRLYKCQLCDKQYLNQSDNYKHLVNDHTCNVCGIIFSSRKSIEIHMREQHEEIKEIPATQRKMLEGSGNSMIDEKNVRKQFSPYHLCGICGSSYKKLRLHKPFCRG